MPFYLFFGEGSRTKIDCRKKSPPILTSLLEDLGPVEVAHLVCDFQLVGPSSQLSQAMRNKQKEKRLGQERSATFQGEPYEVPLYCME